MKFCKFCDNMMYIRVNDDDKLQHYCKNCNHIDEHESMDSMCLLDNNYIDDDLNYQQYTNEYLKYDNTLPRVNNIECPNSKCTRKADDPNDVIFIKYDFHNMKYLYHCSYCQQFWRT